MYVLLVIRGSDDARYFMQPDLVVAVSKEMKEGTN